MTQKERDKFGKYFAELTEHFENQTVIFEADDDNDAYNYVRGVIEGLNKAKRMLCDKEHMYNLL